MMKTLTTHGNSLALILDKPVLELLNINKDTPLEITTDGHSLTISPVTDADRKRMIATSLKKINRRYGNLMRKLAD